MCSAVVTAKSDQKQDPRQAWNKSGAPLASSDAPGGVTHGISTRLTHPLVPFLESVWVLKFDCFLLFFEKSFFAILGAIREAMGPKVVPEGSQKGSQRDNFVGRVDF